ncbi:MULTISPECIES: NAD-dependent epimerase/dehydratase family protein [unclassified Sphingomonas]|jgi:hypothetical protein|uniref:NAD-dependent epimerase/dehydratase family protein n=1 Tax=unclassified Sphingomonas TaxID=196159 RepID=UPI000832C956|nr:MULTISPECIES: NAD(P)-dependent oxidoreductase [unclassified Sphingomonas]
MVGKHVLVTGASGRIGRNLVPALVSRGHVVVAADIEPNAELAARSVAQIQLDITDAAAMERACADVDTIVQLAGHADDAEWNLLHDRNVAATLTLCRAVRPGQRIIFASSLHAAGYAPFDMRFDHRTPSPADSLYGVSKLAAEALLTLHHARGGGDVYILRIGTCRPIPMTARERVTWLSPADCVRLVDACIRDPAGGHHLLWGFSANAAANVDRDAWCRVGYNPQDDAARFELADDATDQAGTGRVGGRFIAATPGI